MYLYARGALRPSFKGEEKEEGTTTAEAASEGEEPDEAAGMSTTVRLQKEDWEKAKDHFPRVKQALKPGGGSSLTTTEEGGGLLELPVENLAEFFGILRSNMEQQLIQRLEASPVPAPLPHAPPKADRSARRDLR